MKFPNRIPTIIGILLVIAVVGGIIFSFERIFRTDTNASGSREPKQLLVTNISDSAFTVSWTTEIPTTGTLLVSTKGKSNKVYFDDRDTTGKLGTYNTHNISVRDAVADSEYLATPLVNGKPHILINKPIPVHVPSALPLNTGGLEPAYGTIVNEDGTPASDTLVYLTIEGGQELSALSKPSGSWIIPLNQVRTADLTSYLPVIERMNESIQMYGSSTQSRISTDSLNDSPVPEVTLGKEYDFKHQQAKKSDASALALRPVTPTPQPATEGKIQPVISNILGSSTQKIFSVSLTNPKDDSSLSTTLPFIQGTGIPGKFVGISIGLTNPSHGSSQVAPDGTWSFTPKKALSPGKQSVTISTIDVKGKAVAITHMFSIFKSGTQVLGTATASATLQPTIPSTITNVPTITDAPIEESTIAGTPPPVSGNELPTLIMILVGIGLIAGGSILFIF